MNHGSASPPPGATRQIMGADVLDPRPGGTYRVQMSPGVAIRGEYVVVEPPHRLVYTWGWETTKPLPGGVEAVGPGSTVVEIDLVPDGEGTILRIRHSGFEIALFPSLHRVGWATSLERLSAAVAGGDAGQRPHGF